MYAGAVEGWRGSMKTGAIRGRSAVTARGRRCSPVMGAERVQRLFAVEGSGRPRVGVPRGTRWLRGPRRGSAAGHGSRKKSVRGGRS